MSRWIVSGSASSKFAIFLLFIHYLVSQWLKTNMRISDIRISTVLQAKMYSRSKARIRMTSPEIAFF